MAKYSLLAPLESRGVFWIPGDQSRRVPGLLRFVPGVTIDLALSGALTSLPTALKGDVSMPMIAGSLVDGTTVAAIDCFQTSVNLGAGAVGETQYFGHHVLLGGSFTAASQIQTRRLRFRTTGLNSWVGSQAVAYEFRKDAAGRSTGVDVAVANRRHYQCSLLDRRTLTIESELNLHLEAFGPVTCEAVNWIEIEFPSPVAWPACGREVFRAQALLSLLTGAPVYLDTVLMRRPDDVPGSGGPDFCSWLFLQRGKPEGRLAHPAEMFAPFSAVQTSLGDLWAKWSSEADKLDAVVGLFFSTEIGQEGLLDARFLQVMQALESFHRVAVGGQYLSKEDYEALVNKPFKSWLPVTLPEALLASLKSRMSFGYEYSLRKRLSDLARGLSDSLQQQLFSDVGRFIGHTVDTRNHLTHYDESSKGEVLEGEQLLWALEQARLFLASLLLRRVGLEDNYIAEALGRNPRARHWLGKRI